MKRSVRDRLKGFVNSRERLESLYVPTGLNGPSIMETHVTVGYYQSLHTYL